MFSVLHIRFFKIDVLEMTFKSLTFYLDYLGNNQLTEKTFHFLSIGTSVNLEEHVIFTN